MLDLSRFKQTYFEECAELLDVVYAHLASLEAKQDDEEAVHAVFRAVHSIKGGGGAFGFERMVAFAHAFETVLDMLRDGRLSLKSEITALMLRATDMLADLIDGARSGEEPSAGVEGEILQALHEAAEPDAIAASATVASPTTTPTAGTPTRWRIRFTPYASLYASANEPLLIFRELARHGELSVLADLSRLPDLTTFDPEEAYLAWEMYIHTTSTASALDVWSRDLVVRVMDEPGRLLRPGFADGFVGGEAA